MKLAIALIVAVAIQLGGFWFSSVFGPLDKPHLYADTKGRKPIPTLQGVWLIIAMIVGLGVIRYGGGPLDSALIFCLVILGVVATLDDVAVGISLPALLRLIVQIVLSAGIVWVADLPLTTQMVELPVWLGYALSTGRFVLCINAFNRFDGINGQASGMATIGFATIALLLFGVVIPSFPLIAPETLQSLSHVGYIAILAGVLALVASVIEWRPSGLVRDVGTRVYGFLLAYCSLAGGAKIGTMLVVLLPVILDAMRVCAHRIFVLKKAPRKGDYTHLHHRLQGLGRSKRETKAFVRIWGIVMMTIMLIQGNQSGNKIVIFVLMAAVFWGVNAYLFWIKKLPVGFSQAIRPVEDEK